MEIVLASLTNIPKYMTGLIFCTTGINIFFLSSSTWLTPYLYSINMTDPLFVLHQHDWPLIKKLFIPPATWLTPHLYSINMTDLLSVPHQHDWPLICTQYNCCPLICTPINMNVPSPVPPSTWLAPYLYPI